nr:MAG TPA: hypothetical protein [Caudoviricetes sp.]
MKNPGGTLYGGSAGILFVCKGGLFPVPQWVRRTGSPAAGR